MPPTVPDWFAKAVQDYDGALRLRWSDHSQQFVLERRMSNTPVAALLHLMQELNRIASKPLKEPLSRDRNTPVHIWEGQRRAYLRGVERRVKCQDQLDSLTAGHHFIFWVPPPLTPYLLECVLFTLRETDVWSQGGTDKMANAMDYEDDLAERRQEQSRASDHRALAAEAFMHSQAKAGERIIHPGFNPTSKKGVTVG